VGLDVAKIKLDFPILERRVHDKRLVYLDSASSSQKPTPVLDAMDHLYATSYANVHRGVYSIAVESTDAYEAARAKVARFVNARETAEIVFVRNGTEAINLVAYTWGRQHLHEGDVVVLSEMEHHANLVPWLMLADERGIELRWIPLTADFRLDLTSLGALLKDAKLLAISAMSNVLGTINDIGPIARAAHAAGAAVLVDACQAVPHLPVDVQEWDADFVAITGHKMLGPSGIGALWARKELLEAMPPFLGGGDMITDVRLDGFTPNEIPVKFEAGTPPIAEAIGLGAACDYLTALGMVNVRAHEMEVTGTALDRLTEAYGDDITIHGPRNVEVRGGAVSFAFRDLHPHDISQVLDQHNVCVRAGHHCAKPLMRLLGVGATARASFYVYNDAADVEALIAGLDHADDFFAL
jgi:cysteine desulfurase / selenocysteine lyase